MQIIFYKEFGFGKKALKKLLTGTFKEKATYSYIEVSEFLKK